MYNPSEANRLKEELLSALNGMKSAIVDGWEPFKNVFRTNWVGEDENAFEDQVAKALIELYANSDNFSKTSAARIIDLANMNIRITNERAQAFESSELVSELDPVDTTAENIELASGGQTFDEATSRGLTNGSTSANQLQTAIDDYYNSICTAVDVYRNIEPGTAFVSEEYNFEAKLREFLNALAESTNTFANIIKELKEQTIPALVSAFNKQASATQESLDQNINDIGSAMN